MKRILLTSTALTMVAGIAAADVSVSGSFKLGFNDTQSNTTGDTLQTSGTKPALAVLNAAGTAITAEVNPTGAGYVAGAGKDNNYGVYNDAGITFAMSSTMDSGMTVAATVDMNGGDTTNNVEDAYTLALASDGLNVSFGSTEYSARSAWKAAGDMATDGWYNQGDAGGNVLKADVALGSLAVSASAQVVSGGASAAPNPISLSIAGSLGGANYVIANEGSMMGISATTAVGGASVTTAYSTAPAVCATACTTESNTSTGVSISYPMGTVTTTASYSMESVSANNVAVASDSWNVAAVYTAGGSTVTLKTDEDSANSVEGSTTLGGATVYAGLADGLSDMYLAVSNPLGGGATLKASYAVDGNKTLETGNTDALDEVGAGEWQEGLTVELSFAF